MLRKNFNMNFFSLSSCRGAERAAAAPLHLHLALAMILNNTGINSKNFPHITATMWYNKFIYTTSSHMSCMYI